MAGERKKILVFTHVFPNPQEPNLGVFVLRRIEKIAERADVKVVAPVPAFPLLDRVKGIAYSQIPLTEMVGNIEVHHPRFFYVPGLMKWLDGYWMFLSVLSCIKRLRKRFAFDLIDAHFAYPDGVAAWLLARFFRVPFAITLRGNEVYHNTHLLKRPQIKKALRETSALITVSRPLLEFARNECGVGNGNTWVIPNGVDDALFKVIQRNSARVDLGVARERQILITVGGLIKRKGIDRVVRLLPHLKAKLPGIRYIVIGGKSREGDETANLQQLVAELGLQDTVQFLGILPQAQIVAWLNAADVFVLLTEREGCPNAVIEALACGVPVVTTPVGANPDLIKSGSNGFLVDMANGHATTDVLLRSLNANWNRAEIRATVRDRSWDVVADEVLSCLGSI